MVAPTSLALPERVARFGRLLRGAGLPLGPGQIVEGVEALTHVDVTRRAEVYWALHCAWVKRGEDRDLFREAFRLFWREPERPVNRVLEELLASSRLDPRPIRRRAHRRVLDALDEQSSRAREAGDTRIEVVRLAASDVEILRQKDFEQMTAAELAEARRVIEGFRFQVREMRTRRWRPLPVRGEIDVRRTVRGALRRGRDHIPLHWRRRRTRPPGIVALCDISGSMAGYSRMMLRFLHALSNGRDRVHVFLFGTRLSNATRSLRRRDPDEALEELGRRVRDWEGGTRIGACLADFNRHWSRRVLAQGAVVLMVTDGLDRGAAGSIEAEMRRLRGSARRVIWLCPLLRYSGFQPLARGIREMLPFVDDFRPAHDLVSLEALAEALAGSGAGERPGVPRGRRGGASSPASAPPDEAAQPREERAPQERNEA